MQTPDNTLGQLPWPA